MNTVRCVCCGLSVAHNSGNSPGDILKETGFTPAHNVGGADSISWICPLCWEPLATHLRRIADMFGEEAEHIQFTTLIQAAKRT